MSDSDKTNKKFTSVPWNIQKDPWEKSRDTINLYDFIYNTSRLHSCKKWLKYTKVLDSL